MTLLLIFLPVIYTHYYHNITGAPKAKNGIVDLSNVGLEHDKIYLDGQWEFYWNSFIVSEDRQYTKSDLIIEVPDEWSEYKIDGERLPAGGVGSYKLVMSGLAYDKTLTLFLPDFGGAYKVFIDGQLTATSGIASRNTGKIHTVPKADLYPLILTDALTHVVVIEVATTRFSGLYMTPVLGDYQRIVNEDNNRSAIRFMLFGIALFAFIILIAMYTLLVRQKWQSFWMPVMIMFILLRIMLTTEFYSFWQPILFNNLSYESTNELMYFTTFVLKYLLIFLVEEQCGIAFSKREKVGFVIYFSLLYLIYLLVPKDIYNQYLSVLIPMLTFALDFYLFVKIYLGIEKLKKFGMVVFLAAILVIIGLANDSFYINGKIFMNTSLSMMLYFMVFSIIMSVVYALRIGDLYDDFAVSSSRLNLANKQIVMQKEYYGTLSDQMKEIRKIKHDISHFIGVMSRLAEEGNFDKLKVFLSEYCERTEMDQLPVFCENTIANSIIGYYFLRAKESEIRFESKCNISEKVKISDSDLCIILGNALENAVHACRQMDLSMIRYVSIEAEIMKGLQLIKVKNSYQGQLEMNEGRYVSSKQGDSHGLGIQNIEKVVEAYNGLVKIEHEDMVFTVMAAIPQN
ncbi:MAG: sensor histidine kinase [Mobilitalea sp.]